jgi:hypothetical protein
MASSGIWWKQRWCNNLLPHMVGKKIVLENVSQITC